MSDEIYINVSETECRRLIDMMILLASITNSSEIKCITLNLIDETIGKKVGYYPLKNIQQFMDLVK